MQAKVSVARLEFLMPNSRNLALLKVFWHEKILFGTYVIASHDFGHFNSVGRKRRCLAFFESLSAVSLNFDIFSACYHLLKLFSIFSQALM